MVSPQAMNLVLRQLAARKLVQKRAHPHSERADAWHLTPKGQEARARAREIFGAVMARMLKPLKPAEVRAFERYLQLCAGSLAGP
jgi:DNA-binding MarR family transcriptional regulator